MIVHLREILPKTEKNNYALGSFNTFNLEITLGIAQAALARRSPVIIAVSEKTIQYAGLKPITHVVKTVAKNVVPEIPVVLHLDHGKTFHSAAECIKAGFSSIMIDASNLPFDENINLTKDVVKYAHKHKVFVQGELGRVLKTKEEIKKMKFRPEEFMTDPDQAVEFVKKTGVDTLAVAIGNIHGPYKMKHPARLDFKRLKAISKKVRIPLVLHGASGLKSDEIKKAIALGVKIINIDTEIRLAFSQSLRSVLFRNKEIDPRKILSPSIKAVQKIIEEKIEMFGSVSKV